MFMQGYWGKPIPWDMPTVSWEEAKGIRAHRMHKHTHSSSGKNCDISDLWILFILSVLSA